MRSRVVTALGYIRRSKESGQRTVSLEDQRARIAEYCRAQGWQLAEVLVDDGVSGGRRERRERLERLTERVKATGARVIVVYHLDRFARDLAATLDSPRHLSTRISAPHSATPSWPGCWRGMDRMSLVPVKQST